MALAMLSLLLSPTHSVSPTAIAAATVAKEVAALAHVS